MKDATQFHIRPARPEEAGLFYTPHPEEDKSSQQFITLVTKAGNTFYLIYEAESDDEPV